MRNTSCVLNAFSPANDRYIRLYTSFIAFFLFFFILLLSFLFTLFSTPPESPTIFLPTRFKAATPLCLTESFSDLLFIKRSLTTELPNSLAAGATLFTRKGIIFLLISVKKPPPLRLGVGVNIFISLKAPPLEFLRTLLEDNSFLNSYSVGCINITPIF